MSSDFMAACSTINVVVKERAKKEINSEVSVGSNA
jgi:hypothetical protein